MRRLFSRIADYIRETDKILFALCIAATAFGCLSVLSATRFTGSMRQFIMQNVGMVMGLVAAVVLSLINYEKITKFWFLIAAVGIIPVALTFVIGVGPAGTDDKAWLNLGVTTFQPSELLKACFILTFSYHISKVGMDNINKLKYLIPVCIHGAIPVVLIHFQGDDGTALVFAIMVLCMLWAGGVKKRYFVTLFVLVIAAAPLIYFFVMNPEHQARVKLMFDIEGDLRGSGWQQWRGRVALANGGLFGQGLFRGTLTQMGDAGVPEGYNDFIFVTIGEEWGFVGCIVVMALLFAICIRCISVSKMCRKPCGKLICIGFFGQLAAQIIINLGMCLSLLPVIGVTLPFFSAGGTSLSCLYLGVGLVLSVYMHRNSRTLYLHD